MIDGFSMHSIWLLYLQLHNSTLHSHNTSLAIAIPSYLQMYWCMLSNHHRPSLRKENRLGSHYNMRFQT